MNGLTEVLQVLDLAHRSLKNAPWSRDRDSLYSPQRQILWHARGINRANYNALYIRCVLLVERIICPESLVKWNESQYRTQSEVQWTMQLTVELAAFELQVARNRNKFESPSQMRIQLPHGFNKLFIES